MKHLMPTRINRRAFLQNGSLLLLGATTPLFIFAEEKSPKRCARVGMITDLHYADKPKSGNRHYRETLAKIAEAGERFQKDKPELIVELGDFIDAADSVKVEKQWLQRINKEFNALPGKKHYVLGNHCVTTLTKEEFLEGVEREKSFYSFDSGGFHFVILDSCFRSDGKPYGRKNFKWTDPNVPASQVDWLRADLKATRNKVIVFAHQRLDVGSPYGVKNAKVIRKVLEDSKKVLAVFQGHSHKNDYKQIGGIHYCTLVAMVEGKGKMNNGYSSMDLFEDGTIQLDGHRKQKDYRWD